MNDIKSKWPEGIKKTKQRESILFILENSEKPLSAGDICFEMEKEGETAWMSTVYRSLEIFVEHNMVTKINVLNNKVALYELNRFEHKHYAVCINCHKIIPIGNCPMERFVPELEDKDFSVLGHNLELFGYCKDCKNSKRQ